MKMNDGLDRPPPVVEVGVERDVGVHGGETTHGEGVAKEDEVVVVVGLTHRKAGTASHSTYEFMFTRGGLFVVYSWLAPRSEL